MKTVLQTEKHECGLACLAMIAIYHGFQTDLNSLRRRFSISSRGTDLSKLISYAQAMNFSSRPLRLELEELNKLKVPCILHWNMNHFVILEKVSAKRLYIIDPALGRRSLSISEASSSFTGVALELMPNQKFEPQEISQKVKLSSLIGRSVGLKRSLLNILALTFSLEIISLLTPQVTQWIVDGALVSSDHSLLQLVVIGGCILTTIDLVFRVAKGWMALNLNQQLILQWSTNLLGHLVKLPWRYFESRHLGDIVSRFQSLSSIRNVIANGAITAVLDGIVMIITLGMMILYSPLLALVVITALFSYILMRAMFYSPLRSASEERIVLSAKEQSFFLETIRAILPLKISNTTSLRVANWQNLLVDVQNRDVKTQKILLMFSSLNTFIFGVEGMAILYIGGSNVINSELSLGMLLAFIAYKSQFTSRASRLVDLFYEVKMLSLHAERLADIALESPEVDLDGEVCIDNILPTIEVRNVSFRYSDGDPWIFREVSCIIESGKSVVITGASGCGKSTLLKLLLGLLSPSEGEILIGGVPIRQLGCRAVRNLSGTVMQDDCLLSGTIGENISSFSHEHNQLRVEQAAKMACIHDAIVSMPMGYQTVISEMGAGFSGGQRQRIYLARAFYKSPKILFLDEATSNLDMENEFDVLNAVLKYPCTKIMISHRKDAVRLVDYNLHVEGGKVHRI
ncbi:peptidase domain-containing ABC transporter [Aeromonas jandaei]|uniref:Peptidase domain-containing ABC transporter n=2 Tax=Aeromonas jandaei TaxID=650 RepID=A0A7T4ABM9_AERJA|nr:peptidase domain-containing ABC transporter [Aeromonas jandaei]QQB20874.1 peptidase domain-containing ABC transporter [Aeromonas jandaei]UCA31683.1 peptidase domain-containing ABC transporter [Aeromonas jandaei]